MENQFEDYVRRAEDDKEEIKSQLAQCQERLAEAKHDADLMADGYEVHVDWLKRGIAIAVSKLGNCPCCKSVKEYFKEYISHAPSDWVAVQRDKLTTALNRWDALELDIAIKYGDVEPVPELVEVRNSLKAALEGKP